MIAVRLAIVGNVSGRTSANTTNNRKASADNP
jgi:hypothetical protein